MLNYFNFKQLNSGKYLITNDFGRYLFVSDKTLSNMVHSPEKLTEEEKIQLTQELFFVDQYPIPFNNEQETFFLRDIKNYLFSATSLHIFVVTNACNLNCKYCQANDGSKLHIRMNEKTAKAAVDIALSSPQKRLTFEFQGGEPLLNFETIKFITEYAELKKQDRDISYSIVTNLTLITDEMIDFLVHYHFSVSTSLDGPECVHNNNRHFPNGKGSYYAVIEKIALLKEAKLQLGAIETTTKNSLSYPTEIIDEYVKNGFPTIFIRPLSPLGCAKKEWDTIGYSEEEFIAFYKQAFEYIVQLNKRGVRIQEYYATLLFSKIIHHFPANYMELRSPCGASLGQLAYYVNGDVFTCDEGRMMYEMGDSSFRLGNVFSDTYRDLITSPSCRALCLASNLESIPGCCDCVYQPYCGVCPVINKAMFNDIIAKAPNYYRCKINQGILDYLFGILQENDPETIQIISNWRL